MRNRFLFKELVELRSVLIRFVALFLFLVFILLATSLAWTKWPTIGATHIPILTFGTPSLATQLFTIMKTSLVPQSVSVIALDPLTPFIAPISIAFMTAFILSFPYLLFALARYISPALYEQERRSIFTLVISSVVLFLFGCVFAYTILIPSTFAILYSFAEPLGVTPFFSLDAFIKTVFGVTIATGIAFLVPIAMIILSFAGFVPVAFWRTHWRIATLVVLAFSAIITPDGSGVTMAILFVPLMLLYGLGIAGNFMYNNKEGARGEIIN